MHIAHDDRKNYHREQYAFFFNFFPYVPGHFFYHLYNFKHTKYHILNKKSKNAKVNGDEGWGRGGGDLFFSTDPKFLCRIPLKVDHHRPASETP